MVSEPRLYRCCDKILKVEQFEPLIPKCDCGGLPSAVTNINEYKLPKDFNVWESAIKQELMNVLEIDYDKILMDNYLEHGTIIVGFDFDNTVYDYHKIGLDCSPIINLLERCDRLAFTLICISSEKDEEQVKFKTQFVKDLGLRLNGELGGPINVGDGIVYPKKPGLTGTYNKIYANIYLDDKGGLKEAYTRLKRVVEQAESDRNL